VVGGPADERKRAPAHRPDGAGHARQAGEQVEQVGREQPPGDQQRDHAQNRREHVLDRAVQQPGGEAVPGDLQLWDAPEPGEENDRPDLEGEQRKKRPRSPQEGGLTGCHHRLACLRAVMIWTMYTSEP